MPQSPPVVLCFGIAVQDLVFQVGDMPHEPVKYRATGFAAVGGGMAANAAVTIARLGGTARLISALGDDTTGQAIKDELETYDVDCTDVAIVTGRTSPISAVFVDDAGERMIVNYKDPDLVEDQELVPDSLDGIDTVMADLRWEEGATRLFEKAAADGLPRVLDADKPQADDAILRAASHVAFSAPALRDLTGIHDLAAALRAASARTGAALSVTNGANGVLVLEGEAVHHIPAFPVDVVDTNAAGDVFHGALALALAEDQPHLQALRFAAAAAALKCARFGGRAGIPDRAAVEALLTGVPA